MSLSMPNAEMCSLCQGLDTMAHIPTDGRSSSDASSVVCAHCQLPISLRNGVGVDVFESFAEHIYQQFQDSPFAQLPMTSFSIGLSLPPLLLLTGWMFQRPLDLKGIWKARLALGLSRLSHLVEDKGSAFLVVVHFHANTLLVEKLVDQILSDTQYHGISLPMAWHRRDRSRLVKSRGALQTLLSALPAPSERLVVSLASSLSHETPVSIESVHFSHAPIYVAGRYVKNTRQWSQSPWLNEKTPKGDQEKAFKATVSDPTGPNESVAHDKSMILGNISDLIGKVLESHFGSPNAKFSSAGREDLDVRMLGPRGRPFLYEITLPTRLLLPVEDEQALFASWCDDMAAASEQAVLVHSLARVDGALARKALLDGESTKSKVYQLLAYSEQGHFRAEAVDALVHNASLFPLRLTQRTPIRCLRSRSNLTREKWVHRLVAERLSDAWLRVTLQASAGTYIKEFVHSDFGRTTPSLATLLGLSPLHARLEIYSLDVLDIDIEDWPPKAALLTL